MLPFTVGGDDAAKDFIGFYRGHGEAAARRAWGKEWLITVSTFCWPAFLTGLLVLATHVPLGQLVLDRGIVFIDLAIAQVAGLGVVAADFLGWEPSGWSVQIARGDRRRSPAPASSSGPSAGWRRCRRR